MRASKHHVGGRWLYLAIIIGFSAYSVNVGAAVLKIGSQTESLRMKPAEYIYIPNIAEDIYRSGTVSSRPDLCLRKMFVMFKSDLFNFDVRLANGFSAYFIGIGERWHGRKVFSQERFDPLSPNNTSRATDVCEGDPDHRKRIGWLAPIQSGGSRVGKELGKVRRFGEDVGLLTFDARLDGSPHLPPLPQLSDPLESGQERQGPGNDYEQMTVNRLLVGVTGYVGGFFLALAGLVYIADNRRWLRTGVICGGVICSICALGYWLTLPLMH